MIENYSDLLSAVIIVLIPMVMFIFLIKASLSTFSEYRLVKKDEKQIEYYKEW